MLDPLKNSILASLGLASLAQEKLQSTVKELIERGEMTKDQGKKLLEVFLSKGGEESEDLSSKLSREMGRWLEKTPFVSRHEFEALVERVRALEGVAMKGSAPAPDEVEPHAS